MDWVYHVTCLRDRLPELERQISKFGDFFPLNLLPSGLFRNVCCGMDCIADITRDLESMTSEASDQIMVYWSTRLSQKIHVLVHICRTQQSKFKKDASFSIPHLGTRTQWLEQAHLQHDKLSMQRLQILGTLAKMRSRDDLHSVSVLQSELNDIDRQLAHLFVL